MSQLTKREKVLLYLLGLIILVAGGVYLILLPTAEKAMLLEEQLSVEQSAVEEQQMSISLIDTFQSQITGDQKEIASQSAQLYPRQSNEEIDRLFQGWMNQHQIRCTKLSMSDTDYRGVLSYEEMQQMDPDAEVPEDYAYSAYLTSNTVTVEGIGTKENIEAFAVSFAEMLAVQMKSITWETAESGTQFAAVFEIYMYE